MENEDWMMENEKDWKMEFKSVWTIFIRPDPNQTLDSLPPMLQREYNHTNFNKLMPIWSDYDPTEKQKFEMWSYAAAALHFGVLEVYLAIEDAMVIDRYFITEPHYDIKVIQTRILKTPPHLTNHKDVMGHVDWFNNIYGESYIVLNIEGLHSKSK